MPHLGYTLAATTTVEGLRQNRRRPDRAPMGLVALRIRTVDQHGRDVLDFCRCAMLPCVWSTTPATRTTWAESAPEPI
ncbi:hypothetical protein [Nocardia vinacea]|uniref:hypothetical protein n=1 Tax=Nocardia vinacea TaxID=96468 RepID=UPI003AF375EC